MKTSTKSPDTCGTNKLCATGKRLNDASNEALYVKQHAQLKNTRKHTTANELAAVTAMGAHYAARDACECHFRACRSEGRVKS